ncbi:pyridoxamine 5'-phosphate oxidase family protein [Zoogloea sp.]|uniref:pyridoxamine 5'-phosphate oxidase family protein n=1 Tax=Zoogloea sp. TaxID=49181 RepID=UPI001ACA9D0D|nr:pyridoxamine 5'-phosphate oxidase family protein [Zoogloea sp.]MBN8284750.1 pyridoxamine 5'-phosphate oxidase family protein [Zoogloea sp.]
MTSPDPLDPALAEFITSHVSLQLAATDDAGLATAVRCVGCRVSADRRRVTLLMPRSQAAPVLASIAANGRVAVVFNEPKSYRTLQLKGRDGRIEPPLPDDAAALQPYAAGFARRLAPLDVPEPYVRTLVSCAPEDLVAVSFTPLEAYAQTPGPRAGRRLGPGETGE